MNFTAKFSLYSQQVNKHGESPIYILYTYNRKVSRISTGITVKACEFVDGRISNKRDNYIQLNEQLHKQLTNICGIAERLIQWDEEPTIDNIRVQLHFQPILQAEAEHYIAERNEEPEHPEAKYWWNRWKETEKQLIEIHCEYSDLLHETKYGKADKKEGMEVFHYFDDFLAEMKRDGMKKSSLKHLPVMRKHIFNFKPHAVLTELDIEFYKDLVFHLRTSVGLVDNSVGAIVKRFKRYLSWLNEKGYAKIENLNKWKVFNTPSNMITLSYNEIKQIEDTEVNSILQHTKDTLLLMFYTTVRFSDLQKLHKGMYRDGKIHLNPSKTPEKQIIIPLPVAVQELIKRHEDKNRNTLIDVPTNQYFNRSLKELCKLAGINSPIEIVRLRGKEQLSKVVPKYQAISSHNIRKSSITALLEAGVAPTVVRRQSGHNTLQAFDRYIVHSSQNAGTLIAEGWKKLQESMS